MEVRFTISKEFVNIVVAVAFIASVFMSVYFYLGSSSLERKLRAAQSKIERLESELNENQVENYRPINACVQYVPLEK